MKALTIGASLLVGAFVVARAVLVPLTYDEAAGYLRYTSQGLLAVFNFEVATNHFLNTLLTKLVSIVAGDSEIALRVSGLVGSGLYLWFSILILRDVRHRAVAAAGFVLLHLNPYLLDYFALSRGYSLSLGLLMGSAFFLLRFVRRRQGGDAGTRDLSRALAFGCGSVLSSFSSLDAYLGIVAVVLAVMWKLKPGSREARKPGSQKAGQAGSWKARKLGSLAVLPVVAAIFIFLVLLQDQGLTDRLYEPVSIRVVGLDDGELQRIGVSRIDLRQRPVAVPRQPGGPIWVVDPPSPVGGLRIEVPASAAAKFQDQRAFIETVIGTRPFVERRGTDAIWTMRDAGAVVVLESGPSLSLPRSRMSQFQPLANWGGDGRHIAQAATYTAFVLFVLSGIAVLLSGAGWLFGRAGLIATDDWRALTAGLLWLAALAGPPLYLLKRSEELYFGGTRGFVEDTCYSLIENSFYGKVYLASQTPIVFGAVIATVVTFAIVAAVGRRLGILRQLVPAACMLAIMFVASAAVIVQHRLFDTPFLLSRTALFYLPLFALFATFLFDVIAGLGAPIRALAVFVSGAAAVLIGAHFVASANVAYTWDWKRDAGTRAMVEDLAAVINAERPPGSRVVLGVEPGYSAAAAFYTQKCRTATIEMDTIPSPRAVDFLYVDERNTGTLNVIKRYPVASSVLARPERPR